MISPNLLELCASLKLRFDLQYMEFIQQLIMQFESFSNQRMCVCCRGWRYVGGRRVRVNQRSREWRLMLILLTVRRKCLVLSISLMR